MLFPLFRYIIISVTVLVGVVKCQDIPPFCGETLKNPHGEPSSFTNPFTKPGKITDKFFFLKCIFGDVFEYVDAKHLFQVGTYIAAHKYFAKDPRFKGEKTVRAELFKKFPTPEVSDMDPLLKKQCEANATACVMGVFDRLKAQCKTSTKSTPATIFKTDYEAFVFRQTAMYYLCWYTMKKDRRLMYKPQQPKDCVDTYSEGKDLDYTCLGFLFTAAEEQSEFRRDDWLDSRLKSGQLDYRATYENMKKNAYQCSELWFCPDPCYPNERLFGLNPAEDTRQDDNPCGKLKNPKCNRDPEANANFLDLIGNRFNISCDCRSNKKGTFWNSQCNRCMDMTDDIATCSKKPIFKQSIKSHSNVQSINSQSNGVSNGDSPSLDEGSSYGDGSNYGDGPSYGGEFDYGDVPYEDDTDLFMSGFAAEEEDQGFMGLLSSGNGISFPMHCYFILSSCLFAMNAI